MARYLLDTNILLGIVRGEEFVRQIDRQISFLKPPHVSMLCTVSRGEIYSLAFRNQWGQKRLLLLEETLRKIPFVDISHEQIVHKYAEIECYSQGKNPNKPLPAGLSSRNMTQNDLWIAAAASVLEAVLLTTDNDFDHLNNVFFLKEFSSIRP